MTINSHPETSRNGGRVLMWFSFIFYALFTLVSDSHSIMVQWPWVVFWQIGLLFPVLWLLWKLWEQRQIQALGRGLDWIIVLIIIGLFISTLFAVFPNQARWYAWPVFCAIAALYALNDELGISGNKLLSENPDLLEKNAWRRYQLLVIQGYLNTAFIVVSLWLWYTETLQPELNRIRILEEYGVKISFDFSVLELRNWAPLGHQNYVAGYLLLAIPVLISLIILDTTKRRYFWGVSLGLGLVTLYTTSSRGGWLGLGGFLLFGLIILLWKSSISRLWLGLGGITSIIIILVLAIANNRLRSLIEAVLTGKGGGELAYRWINTIIGWNMGLDHPFSGVGLGGVPLLYQRYRPGWAGRESELVYQLHSSPAQLWAELGIWGILPLILATFFFVYILLFSATPYTKIDRVLVWSLSGGLWGYGLMALTDYQLDNFSIIGSLVIYFACLTSIFRTTKVESKPRFFPSPLGLFYMGIGLLLVVIIWLIPIHRAWQLSSQGFMALREDKYDLFREKLTQAQNLAPWEPYYPYQLGWNLGERMLKTQNQQERTNLLNLAVAEFQRANQISPYQEFGWNNLGWLLLQANPPEATQAFIKAAQLVPAKRGVMYGLGLSLLQQGKIDLGIEAIALEVVRDPIFITSPRWRVPQLQSLHYKVMQRTIEIYTELIEQNSEQENLIRLLHQQRGALFWWQGNVNAARQDLENYGSVFSQNILTLSENQLTESMPEKFPLATGLLLQAYLEPNQRANLLKQAWMQAEKTELPTNLEEDLLKTMAESENFEQWVKQYAPALSYRYQRAGFGVLSRHIDGMIPLDFYNVVDNLVITTWLKEMFPSPFYWPELDLAIQPLREKLLANIN